MFSLSSAERAVQAHGDASAGVVLDREVIYERQLLGAVWEGK